MEALAGKVSWFGGPNDPSDSGHTASGGTTKEPGIAVYNRSTLGGYWRVTTPNGRTAVLKQTDIGPAPWTGRKLDVTYSALGKLGYAEHDFPTDSTVHAEYLGKNPPKQGAPSMPVIPQAAEKGHSMEQAKADPKTAEGLALLGRVYRESGGSGSPGVFQAPKTVEAPTAPSRAPSVAQAAGGGSSGGYVNPHPGFTSTRVDMGVDFAGKPGEHIKAIGDAKILGVAPNWYKGQPYLYYELLGGPRKGQVIYVAEQIEPLVKAGDHVRAGDPIAVYAGSGTGIEEGFGTRGTSTRAQATGNTGDASHGNAPAGKEYAGFYRGLK